MDIFWLIQFGGTEKEKRKKDRFVEKYGMLVYVGIGAQFHTPFVRNMEL